MAQTGESKGVFGDERIFENLSGRFYFEADIIEFLIACLVVNRT